jgi:hypothetical protein
MEDVNITNKKFAENDMTFCRACALIKGIKTTKRQASKWRNKKGIVYRMHKGDNSPCLMLNIPYIRNQQRGK